MEDFRNVRLETRRALFHIFTGLSVAGLLYAGIIDGWVILAVTVIGFILSSWSRKTRLPVIGWFLDKFEREEALSSFPGKGAFFAFVGFLLSVGLFQKDIALASIVILTLGDSVPILVGMKIGRIGHPFSDSKFLEGTIVGFIAAFFGAAFFVTVPEAFAASALAMVAEGIDTFKGRRIEDNITMPLVAGIMITTMRTVL